jgi:hypothetical protein
MLYQCNSPRDSDSQGNKAGIRRESVVSAYRASAAVR